MGMKRKPEPARLKEAQPRGVAEAHGEVNRRHVEQCKRRNGEAEGQQVAGIHTRNQNADDGHADEGGDAAEGERFAGIERGVAHDGLQHLRNQDGGAVERDAEDEHHEEGKREGAAAEEAQLNHRLRPLPDLPKLPHEQRCDAGDADDGEGGDEVGTEPVIFLALVQHDFQAAEAERGEDEAHVVDFDEPRACLLYRFDQMRAGLRPRGW